MSDLQCTTESAPRWFAARDETGCIQIGHPQWDMEKQTMRQVVMFLRPQDAEQVYRDLGVALGHEISA